MSKNFPETRRKLMDLTKQLAGKSPQVMSAFGQLHKNSLASGTIPSKYKELMALGISIVTHCEGCIAFHTHDALKAGATPEEVTEAINVAILMGGGPAVMYAAEALEALQQFQTQ